MTDPRNLEWLNHNAQRAFPFTVSSSRKDTTGAFQLPDDFILELGLSVPAGLNVDPGGFHLYSLAAQSSGYSFTVGYGGTPVASGMFAAATHTYGQYYALRGIGDYVEINGHITIGNLGNVSKQPSGQFYFNENDALIELACIFPDIRGVSSIAIKNGDTLSGPFYGHIVLRAGANVRIRTAASGGTTTLTLDAIEGEGLNEDCVCLSDSDDGPIYTINGIAPTPDGDFRILGGDCVDIEEVANGIQLSDKCSKPCCGCDELRVVTQAVETLASQLETLGQFLAGLEGATTETQGSLLASKLGDRGCNACDEASS